jgi:phosphoribosylglycinamide formyltransferase 1
MKLRVGILGSTRGTASQSIFEAIAARTLAAEVALVVANKADAPILARAAAQGAPALFLSPKGLNREEYDGNVTHALEQARVDVVLLIGYMRIVSAGFVQHWQGRLLNVHPSLLPAFAGLMDRQVHEAVLAAGVPETGCTVHQVTEDVDAGPIVLQKRCAVLPDDTVDTLRERVQALENTAFVEVLQNWSRS